MSETYSFDEAVEMMKGDVPAAFVSSDLDIVSSAVVLDDEEKAHLAGMTFMKVDRDAVTRYKADVLQMMHRALEMEMTCPHDGSFLPARGGLAASGRYDLVSLHAVTEEGSPEYDPEAARLMGIDKDLRGWVARQAEKRKS